MQRITLHMRRTLCSCACCLMNAYLTRTAWQSTRRPQRDAQRVGHMGGVANPSAIDPDTPRSARVVAMRSVR